MHKVVAKAVEAYRRQRILEQANAGYGALRADPQAWREDQEERQEWDGTLAEGTHHHPTPHDQGPWASSVRYAGTARGGTARPELY